MRFKNNLREFIMLAALIVVLWAGLMSAVVSDTLAQTNDGSVTEPLLTVGSKAPTLDIETWLSDREGEFGRTTEFEPGKIYLLDFWTTWSTQSRLWMVKYAALQDQHFDDGLQIIRISDEDEDAVANFLELDVGEKAETIYAEWALGYCVTSDPDRSVHEDYMVAAQQTRLPVVFIVGRTGLVEWMGAPSKMLQPLKAIIADRWDREVFGAKVLAQQVMSKMAIEVRELLQKGETEAALKLIERMLLDAPDSKVRSEMARVRLQIFLQNDKPNIADAFKEVASGYGENAYQLNELAWSIVTRQMGGKKIAPELLEVAVDTAQRAVELARDAAGDDRRGDELLGMILDTYAHLVHLQGDLDKALQIQTEASQINGRDDILEYLDQLEKEAAKRGTEQAENVEPSTEDASSYSPKGAGDQGTEPKKAPLDEAGIES